MKKTILALLLLGSSYAVLAQEDSIFMENRSTLTTDESYNAFSSFTAVPPVYVESYVVRDEPMATDVRWRQVGDWWHAYYVTDGMPNHVYYNSAGETFTVALPVRQSLVPDAVVVKAVDIFGPTVYDINAVRGTQDEEIYLVRILENGELSSHWITADGANVIDVYRVETSDPMDNVNDNNRNDLLKDVDMNNVEELKIKRDVEDDGTEKIKIKTETKDGKETKTKIKDGKKKTKVDD